MAGDPNRLPAWVKPQHYHLSLFDLVTEAPWTYQGRVQIELALQRETKSITLHARYLKIHSAEISSKSGNAEETLKAIEINYDAHKQRCTFTFDRTVPATTDHNAILSISFEGTMNDDLVGFYRSRYEIDEDEDDDDDDDEEDDDDDDDDEDKCSMFSTQFQPCEARRAFPCFDEPNLKATFDFEIETPADMIALSNMPVKEVTPSPAGHGRGVTVFERTPIMSVYLLAWAVGDFEYSEVRTTQPSGRTLPIRLYTTKGLKAQGQFSIELAEKLVPYFTEKFDIEYPLPKLDMLAVHDMADCMENWGLLTFEMIALLFDPATSDPSSISEVAYTVAHEIAHQWFGNLVTMDWWDDLWLNEGFATWAGWLATDHFFPQWNVWAGFVAEDMQDGLELDALRSSHPIRVPVYDDLEVDSIFDSISYDKGCSLIRMVVAHMGVSPFLRGVSNYLKKHSYGNTKAADLWAALSQVSQEDLLPFVTGWVEQVGFPALTVEADASSKTLQLQQRRFGYADLSATDSGKNTWWVPLTLASKKDKMFFKSRHEILPAGVDLPRVPNVDYAGFFRTSFSPRQLQLVAHDLNRLSVTERAGLVADVSALANAETSEVNTATLFEFLEAFQDEDNYHVWSTILSSVAYVQSMFSHHAPIAKGLDRFIKALTSKAAAKFGGWPDSTAAAEKAPIDFLPGELRKELLLTLGLAGDEAVVAQSLQRFKAFFADKNRSAIPPSLQPAVFQVAVKHLGREAYNLLRKEYSQTTSIDGEEKILEAMAEALQPELAADFLQFTFSEDVGIQNAGTATSSLAANADVRVREAQWTYIRENWESVYSRLGGSMVVFERFIRGALETLTSDATRVAIEEFFRDKDTTGYGRGVTIAVEKIGNNARYIERDFEVVREYLGRKGYLSG